MKFSLPLKATLSALCLFGIVSFSFGYFNNTTSICSTITIYSQAECEGLLNIYNTLGGDNWTTSTNWGTNSGNWYGVTMNGRREEGSDTIASIQLPNNNLSGVLTSNMFAPFTELSVIDFNNNTIKAIEDGTFTNASPYLSSLYINHNHISDLKDGAFQGLVETTMSEIDLSYNQISEIKKSDFNGLGLSFGSINLEHNKIMSIEGNVFEDFIYMSYIYLNDNLLTNLSVNLVSNLNYLVEFKLSNNCIDTSFTFNYYCARIVNGRQSSQKVCSELQYSPNTTTTGTVVGTVVYTGGSLTGRTILNTNPVSHTWTENGLFTYDLSTISGNEYLMNNTIIGDVTWIQPVVIQDTVVLGSEVSNIQPTFSSPLTTTNNSPSLINTANNSPSLINTANIPSNSTNLDIQSTATVLQALPDDKIQILVDSNFSNEIKTSYLRAYSNGITSIDSILAANVEGTLIRQDMAKMVVNYAINILKKEMPTSNTCQFVDISNLTSEMQNYALSACKLGLMGLNTDGTPGNSFNPNSLVSRAEFGTVLSRLLYGDVYNTNDSSTWYENHLNALKNNGIIKNIDPDLQELRGYVMLMLMRTEK